MRNNLQVVFKRELITYKAVMKPVEGTILTVAKDRKSAVNKAEETDDCVEVMEYTIAEVIK